jgi:hypothetical protein
MKRTLMLILIILALTGCKGDDGNDGKVYSYLTWTSDVTAFNLESIMYEQPSTYYVNTKYEFIPDAVGRVYWKSNGTWYYLDIVIVSAQGGGSGSAELLFIPKDGDDGQDAIYMTQVSGNIASQYFVRYESIAARSVNLTIQGIKMTEEEREGAIEADTDEENLPLVFKPHSN